MIDSNNKTLIRTHFAAAAKNIDEISALLKDNIADFSSEDIINTLSEVPELIERLVVIQDILAEQVSKQIIICKKAHIKTY